MPGGSGRLHLMCRRARSRSGAPPGSLLGVVARLAETLTVEGVGVAFLGDTRGMVGVADGGIAPRGAADLVAQPDEAGQAGWEEARAGLHVHQLAGARAGVEPPYPHRFALGARIRDDLARELGRDG